MHAGVPVEAAAVADDAGSVPDELAPVPDEAGLAVVVTVAAGELADDVDDAEQPATSAPAASNGMTSNVFFTRSPIEHGKGDAPMPFTTPRPPPRLCRVSVGSRSARDCPRPAVVSP